MKYSHLTFDCYGTLIDWKAGIEHELRTAVGEVPLGGKELLNAYVRAEKAEELSYKKYREVLRDALVSMTGALGKKVNGESAMNFADSVPRWPAFPDTRKFLREMGSRGYKRYILSNVDNDLLEGTIKNNHLEVDGFVTAEDVGSYKPRPGLWLEFVRRTGVARHQMFHIAQSIYHDIVPTQQLGITSAWVNRYGEPLPLDTSPSIVTDNLGSLAGVLE